MLSLRPDAAELCAVFAAFVKSPEFPCVGAKAALAQDQIKCAVYGEIDRPMADIELWRELRAFVGELEPDGPLVQSFVAIFTGPETLDEQGFERALWNRLQCLHNLDSVAGAPWNPSASQDPDSPHFSVSLCGEPFFVIGLHPRSSRPARRFPLPALVFNSHAQFERLRSDGRFEAMKQIIRRNELETTGSVNPMLSDFGEASEARQYSGRKVGDSWTCPFEVKKGP
jgi:uncharacterized protein